MSFYKPNEINRANPPARPIFDGQRKANPDDHGLFFNFSEGFSFPHPSEHGEAVFVDLWWKVDNSRWLVKTFVPIPLKRFKAQFRQFQAQEN